MLNKLNNFAKKYKLGLIVNNDKSIYLIDESIWEINNNSDLTDHLVLGFILNKKTNKYEISFYEGNCLIKYNKEELMTLISLLDTLNEVKE